MRRVTLVIALLALLTLAPGVSASAGTERSAGLEAAVLQEVNAARVARGLRPLARSTKLTRAADFHTIAMLRVGAFEHELPGNPSFAQRLKQFYAPGPVAWSGAENLAMFGPRAPSARAIVGAWLASPGHRTNLLSRTWREMGVSVRFSPSTGGDFGGAPRWVITLDLGFRGPTA